MGYKKRFIREHNGNILVALVQFHDALKNGRNTLTVTGEVYDSEERVPGEPHYINSCYKPRWMGSCGCCHEELLEVFPELRDAIGFHLCSTEGPMHYVTNTVYHAEQHGPDRAWVFYRGLMDPLGLGGGDKSEHLLGYFDANEARTAEGVAGYRVRWDEDTVKIQNLDLARASAVWPDATDEDLQVDPEILKQKLQERLPALLERFRQVVERLGFTYSETPIQSEIGDWEICSLK